MTEMSPLRRRMIDDMTVRIYRLQLSVRMSTRLRSSPVSSGVRLRDLIWRTFVPSRSTSLLVACPGPRSTRPFALCVSSTA